MDKHKALDTLLKLEHQRSEQIQGMFKNDPTGRFDVQQDTSGYDKLARIEKKIAAQKKIVLDMMNDLPPDADVIGFKHGVELAADIARNYNSSSTHPYDLGDCILGKLNQLGKRKIRKNNSQLKRKFFIEPNY